MDSRITIEEILSEDNIEYALKAVKEWAGSNPRVIIPKDSTLSDILFILVSRHPETPDEEVDTDLLQTDLNGPLKCLVIVKNEEAYDKNRFEEKIYAFPADLEQIKREFAGILFKPPVPRIDDPDSARKEIVTFFKPKIIAERAERLKRKQQALSETTDVKTEFSSSAAPAQRERDKSERDSGDSKSTDCSPRSGSSP